MGVYKRTNSVITYETGERLYLARDEQADLPLGIPDVWNESVSQLFPLGSKLEVNDRAYRYAKLGGVAVTTGKLLQQTVPLAGEIDEAIGVPAAGDTAATGVTQTTDATISADEYKDGYLHINDDTGEGYMYRIKTQPSMAHATTVTITLYDPFKVTLGAAATHTLIRNPWKKLIVHPASAPTALTAGVTPIDITANYFFWTQTWGPCPVLTQGTIIIGLSVMPSASVAGAVKAWGLTEGTPNVEIGPRVGRVMAVNADTEYSPIYLEIAH